MRLSRNIKLISVFIMFVSAVMIAGGCGMMDIQTAADGTTSTALTDAIGAAGAVGQSVGMFLPIAVPIGGLLSIIANGILGVVVKRKATTGTQLDKALTSVTAAVNVFTEDYEIIKGHIDKILAETNVTKEQKEEINKYLTKIGNVKPLISSFATGGQIEKFLRMFIKTKEAKGEV